MMDDQQPLAPPPDEKRVFRIITRNRWDQAATIREAFKRKAKGDKIEADLSIICKDDDSSPTCDEIDSIDIGTSHGSYALRAGAVRSVKRRPHSDTTGNMLSIQRKDVLRAGIDTPNPSIEAEKLDAHLVASALVKMIEYCLTEKCKKKR